MEIAESITKLEQLLTEYRDLQIKQQEQEAAKLQPGINNEYWNAALAIGESLVKEPFEKNLELNRSEILILSYGLFNFNLFEWEAELSALATEESHVDGDIEVHLVPNALNHAYRDFLMFDAQLKFRGRQKGLLKLLDDTAQYLRDLLALRERDCTGILSEADAKDVVSINTESDALLRPILEMEQTIKDGGLSRKEDITRFAQMKEQYANYEARREEILKKYDNAASLRQHSTEIEKGYRKTLEIMRELEVAGKELKNANRRHTRIDVQNAVKDELKHLKMLTNMSAQICRLVPLSMPLARADMATPKKVVEAMRWVLDFDPDVMNNRQAKREGQCKVLLVPGRGNGMYDWAKNRLVIPTMSAKSLIENVANAIVMYRVDVDQQFGERALINSYRKEIPQYADIRSVRKLRQTLVEDYVTWMTKEAQGYAVMEKEVRDWFEYNIGPKKNEMIFPRELRTLTLKETNQRLEKLTSPLTGEDHYMLGTLLYKKEDFKAAAEAFAKAAKIKPTLVDAYYSAAMAYRKAKDTGKGNEMLAEFIKRSPQSWWSKKAQEHLTKTK